MAKIILEIEVLNAEKRRVPSKHYVYVILVTWSDGSSLTVFRRYSRFFDLQTKLLDLFPIEGGRIDPEKRVIPCLPGKILFGRSQIKDVAMKRLKEINAYCKSLIKLPKQLSECEEILQFFEVEPDDLDPPKPYSGVNSKQKIERFIEVTRPRRVARYAAMADYAPSATGEVALIAGTAVDVLEKSETGWWFVSSEDAQGWAPSSYLEPQQEAEYSSEVQLPVPSQACSGEQFVCMEDFAAGGADELSLPRGAAVTVLQKTLDGWWLCRYDGCEGYAPGTYLQQGANTEGIAKHAGLRGVEIVTSLQDVSTLNFVKDPLFKKPSVTAVVKQRSLERGGSLKPPPRQSSVMKSAVLSPSAKISVYRTIEAFQDTVGDGVNFTADQKTLVLERTATGWWFVRLLDGPTAGAQGWVPAAYLKPDDTNDYEMPVDEQEQIDIECGDSSESESDLEIKDEQDMYVEPDIDFGNNSSSSSKHIEPRFSQHCKSFSPNIAKRPLPPVPKEEEKEKQANNFIKLPIDKGKYETRQLPPPPTSVTKQPAEGITKQSLQTSIDSDISAKSKEKDIEEVALDFNPKFDSKSNFIKCKNKEIVSSTPTKQEDIRTPSGSLNNLHTSINSGKARHNILNNNNENSGNSEIVRPCVKSMASIFDSADRDKLMSPSKPKIAVKQKPAVASKPLPQSKPSLAPKPFNLAAPINSKNEFKSTGHVSNLVSNLSNKLNFIDPGMNQAIEKGVEGASPAQNEDYTLATHIPVNKCVAIYSFNAENSGEISFTEGNVMEIITEEGEWTFVSFNGQEGWAPAEYLRKK